MTPTVLVAYATKHGSTRQVAEAVAELHPLTVAIFGGACDPGEHRFPFNRMPAVDVRDWAAIRAWSDEVAARFTHPAHAAA